MPLTVQSILEMDLMSDATVLAGRSGLARSVRSATVLDAPDAINWLKGEEFVLTSTYPFRDSSLDELVERLVSRNVAALGLKLNRYLRELPPSMIEMADRLGLPIVSLPVHMAWTDLIHPIVSAHLDASAHPSGGANMINANFARVLRSKYGIEEIAALLHEFLGEPVMVQAWAPDDAIACIPAEPAVPLNWLAGVVRGNHVEVRAVVACPGVFATRHQHRQVYFTPLDRHGVTQGYIAVAELGRTLSSFDLQCILQAREAVTLKLLQHLAELDARQRRRNDLVNILISRHAGKDVIQDVIRVNSRYDIALAARYMVAVISVEDKRTDLPGQARSVLAHALGQDEILLGETGDGRIVLLIPGEQGEAAGRSKEVSAVVELLVGSIQPHGQARWSAGVSQATAVDALAGAFEQAALAMRYGIHTFGYGQVSFHDETGIYQMFAHPSVQGEVRDFVRVWLQPLIDHDAANQGTLMETLHAFLETNGNYREVSRQLGLHHNTVRYRIAQIERLTGRDVLNARVRLHFHLALMLLPLVGGGED